jgi:FixJ family two-component response regulator
VVAESPAATGRPRAWSPTGRRHADIEMPGLDGLSARPSSARPASCRVIVVTTFGRPGYLRRAMEAGASGFLLKDAPAAQLADAIRRVAAGGRVVDPALALDALSEGTNPLSMREREVLAISLEVATIAEIAARLSLSEGTIRNHLSAAIRRSARATGPRRPGSPRRRAGSRRTSTADGAPGARRPARRIPARGVIRCRGSGRPDSTVGVTRPSRTTSEPTDHEPEDPLS